MSLSSTALPFTAALSSCVALCLWSRADESSAIRSMPDAERHVLYQSTLDTLHYACAPTNSNDSLQGFCDDQARFIVQFPECDSQCLSDATRARAQPRR
jgi:hypothetical protein